MCIYYHDIFGTFYLDLVGFFHSFHFEYGMFNQVLYLQVIIQVRSAIYVVARVKREWDHRKVAASPLLKPVNATSNLSSQST